MKVKPNSPDHSTVYIRISGDPEPECQRYTWLRNENRANQQAETQGVCHCQLDPYPDRLKILKSLISNQNEGDGRYNDAFSPDSLLSRPQLCPAVSQ
eukprot:5512175-Alexandrium_andersonii.AAC.1